MIWNKAKRLLVPYFVFSIFFMVTTNSLSIEPLYRGSFWHLWFLPMLFWCFIVGYCLKNTKIWVLCLSLLIFFCFSLVDRFLPMILGLHNLSKWGFWFLLGMLIGRGEKTIFNIITHVHLLFPLLILYLVLLISVPMAYGDNTFIGVLNSVLGIVAIWALCRQIEWKKYRFTPWLLVLSTLSFGIYIFHNWIELYMLSRTAQQIFPLAEWAYKYVYLFPFVFATGALAFSLVLSWLLVHTRWGRFLIA